MLFQNDLLQKKLNGANMMVNMNNLSPYMTNGGIIADNSSSNASSIRNSMQLNYNNVAPENNRGLNELKQKYNNYVTTDRTPKNMNYYGGIQTYKTNPATFINTQLMQNKADNIKRVITVADNIDLNSRKKMDYFNMESVVTTHSDKVKPSLSILKKGKSSSVFYRENIEKLPSSYKVQSYDNYRNVTFDKTNIKGGNAVKKYKEQSTSKVANQETGSVDRKMNKKEKAVPELSSPKRRVIEMKKDNCVEETKKTKLENKSGNFNDKKIVKRGVLKNAGSVSNSSMNMNKNDKKEKKEVIIVDEIVPDSNNPLGIHDKKKNFQNKNGKITETDSKRTLPCVVLLDVDGDMITTETGLTMFQGFISIDKRNMIRQWNGFDWDIVDNYYNFFIKAKYDNQGNIWCINDNYKISKLLKTKVKHYNMLSHEEVIDFAFDKKNVLWCVNRKGQLLKWNNTEWIKIHSTGFHKLKAITFDTNGDLWGLNYMGFLGVWNIKEKRWDKINAQDNLKILTMDFDKNGMLWVISTNGALLSYSSEQWMNHGFVCLDELISISFKK